MISASAEVDMGVSPAVSSRRGGSGKCTDRPPLHFYFTGFAKFHQVATNPTELLMLALPQYFRTCPPPAGCVLISAQTLKVAAETSRNELDHLYTRISDARACTALPSRSWQSIVVHFGVRVSATRFALELQACNEATFRCPDELGWTPVRQPIDKSEKSLAGVKSTSLPVDAIVAKLQNQGFQVDVSSDAGRFVCNWVYYNSLARAAKNDSIALFVHVPLEHVVPIHEQLKFTRALMEAISQSPEL